MVLQNFYEEAESCNLVERRYSGFSLFFFFANYLQQGMYFIYVISIHTNTNVSK